ncbi:unnamed protein product [Macrosiphum euphorbiae]|uniref:Uncharacterized protein n=1 Tax=Macrosiphum euphorbiae TaxID=13131 RepID=A0AAV0WJH9_9HEMI|nr:unnamed protein product [Macrosiphum euphorbiae]
MAMITQSSQAVDCNSGRDFTANKHENPPTCKLLDVKSPDHDNACNYRKHIYAILKKIVETVSFSSHKKTVVVKPIDCCAQNNYNSRVDLTGNTRVNRPNSQSSNADYNSRVNLSVNKYETRPTCEMDVSGDCCEDNIRLKDELAEIEIIKNQLLCEKRMKKLAGYALLFNIRKASLNIKRENILRYYL